MLRNIHSRGITFMETLLQWIQITKWNIELIINIHTVNVIVVDISIRGLISKW
jgi:hypothetical protein